MSSAQRKGLNGIQRNKSSELQGAHGTLNSASGCPTNGLSNY